MVTGTALACGGFAVAILVGNPVADPEHPLEVVRTVHSFDPCLACAVHTHDTGGHEIARVKAL